MIISFSIDLELYALSSHRCCRCWRFCLLVFFFEEDDSKGRLITTSSMTSVTAFMSCLLVEYVITVGRGIPFLSVKICLFAWPNLLLSVGLFQSVISPPKEDFIDMLSSDCQVHLISLLPSYSSNNLIHIFLNITA